MLMNNAIPDKMTLALINAEQWIAYYRENIHRFATEILGFRLKDFQKILLYHMNESTNSMFLASRGLGKTYLVAIFCLCRCILYPGTRIAVASQTIQQGNETIEKIKGFFPDSAVLMSEISKVSISGQAAGYVSFHNGSKIFVVTSTESARHSRASILVIDEFVKVDLHTIQTVLRRFLTAQRQPPYLSMPEYAHLVERNKEIYMSSCWFASHWSYEKAQSYLANMLDPRRKYYICALPYQIAIKEGLLIREQIEDEMSEADFNEISFQMEMEAKWYRDSEGTLYSYETLSKARKIHYPALPSAAKGRVHDKRLSIPEKKDGEPRLLVVDTALMKSKRSENDATSIFVDFLTPNSDKSGYISHYVYTENHEGMLTEQLALLLRRYEQEFDIDYIVIDAKGIGFGVVELLLQRMVDPDSGDEYPALSCINNDEIAARCRENNAPKKIWAIQGTAQLNSECALTLRERLRSGKIQLLTTEFDSEERLADIQGFRNLSPSEKAAIQMPYINTSLFVAELVKLQYEAKGGIIRVQERSGMRKDRYSAASYGCIAVRELEKRLGKRKRRRVDPEKVSTFVQFKKPKLYGNR